MQCICCSQWFCLFSVSFSSILLGNKGHCKNKSVPYNNVYLVKKSVTNINRLKKSGLKTKRSFTKCVFIYNTKVCGYMKNTQQNTTVQETALSPEEIKWWWHWVWASVINWWLLDIFLTLSKCYFVMPFTHLINKLNIVTKIHENPPILNCICSRQKMGWLKTFLTNLDLDLEPAWQTHAIWPLSK